MQVRQPCALAPKSPFRLLLGAVCRRARQDGYSEAQREADSDDSYVLSNEHALVSLSECDLYSLLRNDLNNSVKGRSKRATFQHYRRHRCGLQTSMMAVR